LAKLRHLRVLNRMSGAEAEMAGIEPKSAWRYIRADDDGKPNLVPPAGAVWYEMVSVDLENADVRRDGLEHAESDVIGVPVPWTFRAASPLCIWLSADEIREVYRLMGDQVWRKSWQSKDWVGKLIAE